MKDNDMLLTFSEIDQLNAYRNKYHHDVSIPTRETIAIDKTICDDKKLREFLSKISEKINYECNFNHKSDYDYLINQYKISC